MFSVNLQWYKTSSIFNSSFTLARVFIKPTADNLALMSNLAADKAVPIFQRLFAQPSIVEEAMGCFYGHSGFTPMRSQTNKEREHKKHHLEEVPGTNH
ncbi:MAG: hypothetical protein JWN56_750 [Sphingobacteriales bacterium]|nr:hypothetical protein [Sphingobacteriales bacterium]